MGIGASRLAAQVGRTGQPRYRAMGSAPGRTMSRPTRVMPFISVGHESFHDDGHFDAG